MNVAVFDLEANGLDVNTVRPHCLVVRTLREGDVDPVLYAFRSGEIGDGVDLLNTCIEEGFVIAGHNIINYDLPLLYRFGLREPYKVYDTLMVSRAAYSGNQLYPKDLAWFGQHPEHKGAFRPGAHSLKAWGLRLGIQKGDYDGGWDEFNEEMFEYCKQDVAVSVELFKLLRERIPDEAALLESEVARICRRMRLFGVGFDVDAAVELTGKLATRRSYLATQLKDAFGVWYEPGEVKTPKRSAQSRKVSPGTEGYRNVSAGCEHQDVKRVEFNPASTDHIAKRLIAKYDWKPLKWTDGGKPAVTAEVLRDLTYPEAPLLAEYQEIKKVLGYVSEGNNSWLKLEKEGRLHGQVDPTGTVSGRAAHRSPNTGNVPSRTDLGMECRRLFTVPVTNRRIVGADASGLQLRILAHYLAKWDGGAFARQCEEGDIHEYMRAATGLHTRNRQKTWTYAKLFGAGQGKLGQTAILDHRDAFEQGLTTEPVPKQQAAQRLGKKTLENLGNAIPAFTELERDLKEAARRGSLKTLDGRRIPVGSEHLAIAMLLQAGEAVIMKKAMTIAAPHVYRLQAEFVLWVHDEFQCEAPENVADHVGEVMVDSMKLAGEHFGLRVRIDGEYKVGKTWAETH